MGRPKRTSKAHLISKLGKDSIGADTRRNLRVNGIEDTFVFEDETGASSGAALITVAGGENSIIVVGGANDNLDAEKDIRGSARKLLSAASTGIVVGQLEVPFAISLAAFDVAKNGSENSQHSAVTVLNPSPVPAAFLSNSNDAVDDQFWDLMNLTDVLVPNEEELVGIVRAVGTTRSSESVGALGTSIAPEQPNADFAANAAPLFGKIPNLKLIVCTRGAKGCVVISPDGKTVAEVCSPAFQGGKKVVDTTGAGDCFLGGFCAWLAARGRAPVVAEAVAAPKTNRGFLRRAATFACAAASLSVTKEGTQMSYPTAEEVVTFLMEGPK